MGWIVYPPDLPGPAPGTLTPRGRRAGSSLDGAPQSRARQRDVAGLQQQLSWVYTPDEMALWRAWYETTLSQGRYWFAAYLPGLRGLKRPKLVRYLTMSEQLLGSGLYRVTATLELRAYLPEALYYVSAPYPYVASESLAVGNALATGGLLQRDPMDLIEVSVSVPSGGALRNVLQAGDGGSETLGVSAAVPSSGILKGVLDTWDQYGAEALSSNVAIPGVGAVLEVILVSQDQYGFESIGASVAVPSGGTLS